MCLHLLDFILKIASFSTKSWQQCPEAYIVLYICIWHNFRYNIMGHPVFRRSYVYIQILLYKDTTKKKFTMRSKIKEHKS